MLTLALGIVIGANVALLMMLLITRIAETSRHERGTPWQQTEAESMTATEAKTSVTPWSK